MFVVWRAVLTIQRITIAEYPYNEWSLRLN
jgi:hypothetical protein